MYISTVLFKTLATTHELLTGTAVVTLLGLELNTCACQINEVVDNKDKRSSARARQRSAQFIYPPNGPIHY